MSGGGSPKREIIVRLVREPSIPLHPGQKDCFSRRIAATACAELHGPNDYIKLKRTLGNYEIRYRFVMSPLGCESSIINAYIMKNKQFISQLTINK